jgi:hypothetical protein
MPKRPLAVLDASAITRGEYSSNLGTRGFSGGGDRTGNGGGGFKREEYKLAGERNLTA